MATAPCYSGSNPLSKLSDGARLAAWKWIKENAIDHGTPFEQLHGELSRYFGMNLKPDWVNEFLAARKTPFKRISDSAWAAQANRRAVVEQAKHLVANQRSNAIAKGAKLLVSGPRYVSVGGGVHGVVFPFTHGGALLLNPAKWGAFFRLVHNTWKSFPPGVAGRAALERLNQAMRQSPRYDLAGRLGVDLKTHAIETGGGSASSRTWGALLETRFRMWDKMMDRYVKPGMSQEAIDSIGKEFAVWANHATGSGKGFIGSSKIAPAFFGPKLAQSYWNRLIGDPIKSLSTAANWKNATPGEKAVFWQRLQGSMSLVATYLGALAANQGILKGTNQQQNINFTDPKKSDWLAFKFGGMEFNLPGAMHSEIKLIGQLMMFPFMKPEDLAAQGIPVPKGKIAPDRELSLKELYVARQLLQYGETKATPVVGLTKELATGHDFMGRPLPWSSDPGTDKKPRMSWGEYAWSHAPIPLTGAAKYVYEQLRQGGSSALDAVTWMKAAMISAMAGTTAIELKEERQPTPPPSRFRSRARASR